MQQGQVDWVAFGNTIWSASAAVLQRFSSSGIQPMTFGAALALGSQFRMSEAGCQKMDQAIQSLRGVPGFGKILWFGFGYQSFVKIMTETQLGVNVVALCACLTEVHSEETAAYVLKGLWKLNDFPEKYEPASSQFLALVKACSGVVASSTFHMDIERMTGKGRWGLDVSLVKTPYLLGLKSSNANVIARALHGLFQITRGAVESINLLGSHECAFVAALGYWLFDLSVYVENEAGLILFTSGPNLTKSTTQVLVTYSYSKNWNPQAMVQSTTYILTEGTELVSPLYSDSKSRWVLKIPWDGCLLRTFGSTYRNLSQLAHTLGIFLGSIARIYSALALGEPHVAEFSRRRYMGFSQFSYGQGFIHSVTTTFKELERINSLQSAMEHALESTFERACGQLEEAAQSLRNSCHCVLCSGRLLGPGESPEERENCLFILALLIRNLVTEFSCVNRDEDLPVAMFGLQKAYDRNRTDYSEWIKDQENTRTFVGLAAGLISDTTRSYGTMPDLINLLGTIRSLFDACWPLDNDDSSGSLLARAGNGICCYYECLHGLSSDAGAMRLIHVVPGHIERGASHYEVLVDGLIQGDEQPQPILEPGSVTAANDSISPHKPIKFGELEVKALATESSEYRELFFCYKVLLPDGSPLIIRPKQFSTKILERTGLIACYRSEKCKKSLACPCNRVQKGCKVDFETEGLQLHNRVAYCIWSIQEDLGRCVAIALQTSNETLFIRRDECLPCCTETALRASATQTARYDDRKFITDII